MESFSQSFSNVDYGIKEDNQVLKSLTAEEKMIFYECIKECGLNKDEVIWVTDSVFDLILKDYKQLNCKVVRKHSNGVGDKITDRKSTTGNCLKKPECLLFCNRNNGVSEIILQMYY